MFNIYFFGSASIPTAMCAEDALRCGKAIARKTGRKLSCVQDPITGEAYAISRRSGEFMYKKQEAWND